MALIRAVQGIGYPARTVSAKNEIDRFAISVKCCGQYREDGKTPETERNIYFNLNLRIFSLLAAVTFTLLVRFIIH